MVRNKMVRLSEDEHEKLADYTEAEYPEGVPFGAVINDLLDEVSE